jgi:hypothetical protein
MNDPKRSAEATKRILELQKVISTHQSNLANLNRQKSEKIRYFDQQIKNEEDRVKQHNNQIVILKRQI